MEIKLFEAADKKKSFTFSSLPEKISGSLGTKYQTYDIISQGAVKVPKGTEVAEISWDAVFFGPDRKNLAVVKAESYQKPDKCIKQLREWQEKGTVLNLLVTETWINMDVTIDSFTPDPFGAYGDVSYGIKFSQAKDLKIYTTNELKIAAFVKKTVPRNDNSNKGSSYTIVSGDTLWGIASRKLGSGTKWTKIYDANASTIEATAKKHGKSSSDHGHWIWPGTTLSIPAA